LYWGNSLPRLAALRQQVDPTGLFDGKQVMPSGTLPCPGSLSITGSGLTRNVLIQGYPYGQLSGMRTEVQVSGGCTLGAASGATLTSKGGQRYEAVANGGAAFSVTMSAATCSISTVSINNIICGPSATSLSSMMVEAVPVTGSTNLFKQMNTTGCTKTPLGGKCASSPGNAEAPWRGGCCAGSCVEAPDLGPGKWCV
jgi:hypothetical protein